MRQVLLSLAVIILSSSAVAGTDWQFKGRYYSRANIDIYRDNSSEHLFEWRNKFFFEGKVPLNQNSIFVISMLSEYSIFRSIEDTLYNFTPELYEAYFTLAAGDLDLRVGKQIISWGRSDISFSDALNPFDLRELSTIEEEFLKIPIPMLSIKYYLGDYNIEGVWIPFYYPMRFERMGSDWALLSPTILADLSEEMREAAEGGLEPGLSKLPDANPANSEGGIRLSGYLRNFDYSLSYLYTWEDVPAFYFNPEFIDYLKTSQPGLSLREKLETLNPLEVASFYPLYTEKAVRESILGVDFSTTLLDIAIRGELSYRYRFPFMDENLNVKKKPLLLWSLGGDYLFQNDLYLNLQFMQISISDYEDDLLIVKQFINIIIAAVRWNFLDDKLMPELRTIYNFNLRDWALNLLCFYQITDSWRMGGGWQHFDGTEESIYGFFKKNKNLLIQIRYSF